MSTSFSHLSRLAGWLLSPLVRTRLLPLLLVGLISLSLWTGWDQPFGRMLLLAQYGVLLLWQPVFDPAAPLSRSAILCLLLGGLLLVGLASHGLMMLWLALLASLFGSRSLGARRRWLRLFHLGMLLCLLLLLWLVVTPRLASQPLPFPLAFSLGVPLALLLLASLPVELESQPQRAPVDFFYAVLMLLVALLVPVAAIALDALSARSYTESLAMVLVGLGMLLGALALLWNPRAGFAGVGTLFSMRVLQLGTPFELWSARLTARANQGGTPEDFLQSATSDLLALPGVVGGYWECAAQAGRFGQEQARHNITVLAGELGLALFTEHPVAPALRLQFQLIAELLSQFHQAKLREVRLAEQAYVAAVHQTGARLTHDIKNLLQTLKLLIAAGTANRDPDGLAALYARQLPEVALRLEVTLARLAVPETAVRPGKTRALSWWQQQRCRYADSVVEFQADAGSGDGELDEELFSGVLDNLLANALNKRLLQPDLRIEVSLQVVQQGCVLSVTDTGDMIPAQLLGKLFQRPLPSTTGFGLGLYQMAHLAEQRQHALRLADNQPGKVCFRLAPVA